MRSARGRLALDPMVALFAAGVMMLAGVRRAFAGRPADAPDEQRERRRSRGMQGRARAGSRRAGGLEVTLAIVLVAGAGRLLLSARNCLPSIQALPPKGG
jgi:hypothetical protein